MNNEETPSIPPTPEQISPAPEPIPSAPVTVTPEVPTPSSEDTKDTTWVPKGQYDPHAAGVKKQSADELGKSKTIRTFYIFLAISGLLLFVLYIGMLIWPAHYISKGDCPGQEFIGIAFWLNPLAYIMLLVAGIIGVTTKRKGIIALGILFIIIAPTCWFITGLGILGPILCGV